MKNVHTHVKFVPRLDRRRDRKSLFLVTTAVVALAKSEKAEAEPHRYSAKHELAVAYTRCTQTLRNGLVQRLCVVLLGGWNDREWSRARVAQGVAGTIEKATR